MDCAKDEVPARVAEGIGLASLMARLAEKLEGLVAWLIAFLSWP